MMKIEKLLPPERAGKAWLVYVEGGIVLRVTEGEMADFSLHTGMELKEADLYCLKHATALSTLREKASSMLLGGPLSKEELKVRLIRKGAEDEDAVVVAAWAERIGLVNDAEYAKTVVRHYNVNGYGLYKIKQELQRRRISRDVWEDALEEVGDASEAIDRYLERNLHSQERKAIKKASDALRRRGFSWEEISEGLARHAE